jgi:hypothetical protein
MEYILIQMVLAARRGDDGDWMELLIFIIIAVVYALGGIIKKTRDSKIDLGEDKAEKKKPSVRKQRPQFEPKRAKAAEKPSFFHEVSFKLKKPPKVIAEPKAPQVSESTPVEPVFKVNMKELDVDKAAPVIEKQKPEVVVDSLLHLDDPDELRRAILHYEVLGKPVALR